MARIRAVEIKNFRGIQELKWLPSPGINCLIGPGDSGKTSILDAIDLCMGLRRNFQFTDADFHLLDIETPITITVTLGELDDALKNLDSYGMFVRGFDPETGNVEDEPENDFETVLCLRLTVASDLEPNWKLVSDRAEAEGIEKFLNWNDRGRLSPTRLGALADYHMGWSGRSVLNRVSDERADASAALAKAARDARSTFGEAAQDQLEDTLKIVAKTAADLGIPIGESIKALLDAHSVSFGSGTISLHDEHGIPLRSLGLGSTRLLIAGLQREAVANSKIILVDELEHGLEPHRIIRFLGSLGAKENNPPLQAFMTTHSPVALRELSGSQLFVIRQLSECCQALSVGASSGDAQGTIRLFPDAFLSSSVIVCEGATEVGLVRGVDQYRTANGNDSIMALGVALIDSDGGGPDRPFERANAFGSLGYRTAVIRDDDKKPTASIEANFVTNVGMVVAWRDDRALEDELFYSLSDVGVMKLLDRAIEIHGDGIVNDHIKSFTDNAINLESIRAEERSGFISQETRAALGKAARSGKPGWFKKLTWMEEVSRDIVGPDLVDADEGFRELIESIFDWCANAET